MVETGNRVVARDNGHVCNDCGVKIKIGEEYFYYIRRNKKKEVVNYCYCTVCKKKPEHNRKSYDYDGIMHNLYHTPLFKHEFQEKYGIPNSRKSNELLRRIQSNGYAIKIFRWSIRTRNGTIRKKDEYRQGHQPNQFVIYYVEGTENKVVGRLLDEFDFDHIKWRNLLGSLYGKKIPIAMMNKDTIKQFAEQNAFN